MGNKIRICLTFPDNLKMSVHLWSVVTERRNGNELECVNHLVVHTGDVTKSTVLRLYYRKILGQCSHAFQNANTKLR